MKNENGMRLKSRVKETTERITKQTSISYFVVILILIIYFCCCLFRLSSSCCFLFSHIIFFISFYYWCLGSNFVYREKSSCFNKYFFVSSFVLLSLQSLLQFSSLSLSLMLHHQIVSYYFYFVAIFDANRNLPFQKWFSFSFSFFMLN